MVEFMTQITIITLKFSSPLPRVVLVKRLITRMWITQKETDRMQRRKKDDDSRMRGNSVKKKKKCV